MERIVWAVQNSRIKDPNNMILRYYRKETLKLTEVIELLELVQDQ